MTCTVEILRSVQRQLAKIDRQDRPRIITAIRGLASDPRPAGSKKLSGRPAWRIRVGVYRVIYEIADDRLLVLVVVIGHRKEVYQ
ncbi:MAG: type II toxin-antitoxin system RelE/ParE family toxin [Planctomycetes bacterium]|nr:type II toxin-antitoxin system RelE/ParE family toxin [Planctomycetota bacterium]MCG2684716.1 type II toxin-antitoxin system RelE/ParE family toxin [Planctomycetales bacterium]